MTLLPSAGFVLFPALSPRARGVEEVDPYTGPVDILPRNLPVTADRSRDLYDDGSDSSEATCP